MDVKECRESLGLKEYKAAIRACLKCQTEFESEWKGNRICPTCAETNSEVASYSFDPSVDFSYDLSVLQIIEEVQNTGAYVENYEQKGLYDVPANKKVRRKVDK